MTNNTHVFLRSIKLFYNNGKERWTPSSLVYLTWFKVGIFHIFPPMSRYFERRDKHQMWKFSSLLVISRKFVNCNHSDFGWIVKDGTVRQVHVFATGTWRQRIYIIVSRSKPICSRRLHLAKIDDLHVHFPQLYPPKKVKTSSLFWQPWLCQLHFLGFIHP